MKVNAFYAPGQYLPGPGPLSVLVPLAGKKKPEPIVQRTDNRSERRTKSPVRVVRVSPNQDRPRIVYQRPPAGTSQPAVVVSRDSTAAQEMVPYHLCLTTSRSPVTSRKCGSAEYYLLNAGPKERAWRNKYERDDSGNYNGVRKPRRFVRLSAVKGLS